MTTSKNAARIDEWLGPIISITREFVRMVPPDAGNALLDIANDLQSTASIAAETFPWGMATHVQHVTAKIAEIQAIIQTHKPAD